MAAIAWWTAGAGLVALAVRAMARHEAVLDEVRRQCRRLDVQLLDQTVHLRALRLVRCARGLAIHRRYQFEFTRDGRERVAANIEFRGRQGLWLSYPADGGITVVRLGKP